MDFNKPIIFDNRNLRNEVPAIEAHFAAARKEVESFPKRNGVVSGDNLVNLANCPVCGSDKNNQLFVKLGFIYVKCQVCSHIFVHNQLKEEILLELYSKSISDQLNRQMQDSRQYHDYWSQVYAKYMQYVQTHSLTNKSLLDIGCGPGKFLAYCTENCDFALQAIDFCQDTFEYITQLVGKDNYYFQQKIENIDFGSKKFGLITLWGVLEHLTNPVQILKKCHDILDETGLVLILIPNLYSRAFNVLGINTSTINPREHINFYTDKSFSRLCQETNFSIVDFFQELPVIDLMHPHILYNDQLIEGILRDKESYYRVYILKKNG